MMVLSHSLKVYLFIYLFIYFITHNASIYKVLEERREKEEAERLKKKKELQSKKEYQELSLDEVAPKLTGR